MSQNTSPTRILINGNIHTLDANNPKVESLAIKGSRILAIGSAEDVNRLTDPSTEIIDLEGRTVIPSFTDSHIHLEKLALAMKRVDCAVSSVEECINRVRHKVEQTPPGTWILGHGWDQNHWGGYGTNKDLDTVSPEHPVYLTAKSVHAGWANSMALSIADVDPSTADPAAGHIGKDADGNLTGIVFEEAMKLIADVIPPPSEEELIAAILRLQDTLLRLGVTCVHDFDGASCLQALQTLRDRDQLDLRILKHIMEDDFIPTIEKGVQSWSGDEWIRYGNLKLFADGALGPRTASMLDPYEGSENFGMSLYEIHDLLAISKQAADAGIAVAIHAIGDRANREVLDVIEQLREYEKGNNIRPLPHRIEHLQLLHPQDVSRPAKLGVIASMQPLHATSDMEMANLHWGKRVKHAYAWRSQIHAGAQVIFGSDAPVESPNPFLGLHAAVTRRRVNGEPGSDGWVPHERISVHEAMLAYTFTPAGAAGLSKKIGRLSPGHYADFVVLDVDPYQCQPSDIHLIEPVATMIAGEWRYLTF